jgi:hypothetical protein
LPQQAKVDTFKGPTRLDDPDLRDSSLSVHHSDGASHSRTYECVSGPTLTDTGSFHGMEPIIVDIYQRTKL